MTTNYETQADEWAGDQSKHLSDWIARPIVLERIKEIGRGKTILDIGCGTGYFSRKIVPFVKKVIAFEKSEKMLEQALNAEKAKPLGIEYVLGDMTNMDFVKPETIDICILNFVLPYIHPDEYIKVFKGVSEVLKPGGRFIIIQSHPLMRYLAPTHKGDEGKWKNFNYKKSRGQFMEFQLNKAGGGFVTVGQYNYTFEDLFRPCVDSGLAYQAIKELEITDNIPNELSAAKGEIPYIYLEGVKLPR